MKLNAFYIFVGWVAFYVILTAFGVYVASFFVGCAAVPMRVTNGADASLARVGDVSAVKAEAADVSLGDASLVKLAAGDTTQIGGINIGGGWITSIVMGAAFVWVLTIVCGGLFYQHVLRRLALPHRVNKDFERISIPQVQLDVSPPPVFKAVKAKDAKPEMNGHAS